MARELLVAYAKGQTGLSLIRNLAQARGKAPLRFALPLLGYFGRNKIVGGADSAFNDQNVENEQPLQGEHQAFNRITSSRCPVSVHVTILYRYG